MRFDSYKKKRGKPFGIGRVVIMTALLVAVVGIMLELQRRVKQMELRDSGGGVAPVPARMLERPEQKGDFSSKDILPPAEEAKLLSHVQDQYSLAIREQKGVYYYLLNKLHTQTLEEVMQSLDERATYDDFIDQPQVLRGAVVRLKGHLYRLARTEMDPKKSGLSHVYEGAIRAPHGRIILFVLVEAPTPDLKPGQVGRTDHVAVEVIGAYMMNVLYPARSGEPAAAPLIIAKTVRTLDLPQPEEYRPPLWVGGLLAIAVVGAAVLYAVKASRRTRTRVNLEGGLGDFSAEDFPPEDEDR